MTSAPATSPRIVVGIDGSASSLDALWWAARQADLTAARLEVVMTWEWPSSYGWAVPVPEDLDPEKEVRQTIEKAVASIAKMDCMLERPLCLQILERLFNQRYR